MLDSCNIEKELTTQSDDEIIVFNMTNLDTTVTSRGASQIVTK